ncbi:UDP-N-acetylmuramate dehydrogenase [Thiomicrorhabdus aquaedulcis]|uniref:UDP-N-acetylmuramate dehydrogenase n=1 Tax=Thiomicrorhabdus aquaedulcis TaxID=2211106 RepID=UPI000FD72FD1|nr:UDP-N-acetylmuramate dehydrogenase [Thiomicrorhabdus aquaedulcis]
MHIQANCSLRPYNTFNIDVKTRYYVEINKQSDILVLRTDLKLASLPWQIMGDGSNILFTKDVEGVTVRCSFNKTKVVKEDQDSIWLSVGAGVKWHDLVAYTVKQNWWGLENLAWIPGTVGASAVQNIGAYGAEAQDTITRVQTLNIYDGQRVEFRHAECNFGYRTSLFKQEYTNKLLIHRVTFRLRKSHAGKPNLVYEPLKQALLHIAKDDLKSQDIFEAVIALRQERLPDPKTQGNAGSFFKNPIIEAPYFDDLIQEHPNMPHHKMLDGRYKIPAAWFIEQAQWKGQHRGQAGVSAKHALVLINLGHATGNEIVELAQLIQADVNQKFGIYLNLEVIIL